MPILIERVGLGRPLTHPEHDAIHLAWLQGGAMTLVISAGIITVNGPGWYIVDTEGAAATDELTRINGTLEGNLIELRSASASRVITVQPGAFLKLENDQAKVLASIYDGLILRSYGGDVLVERHRANIPGL